MKLHYLLAAASFAILPACEEQKGPSVKDKVDDALNRRPNEKIKDSAEEIKDDAKEIKEDVKDATR